MRRSRSTFGWKTVRPFDPAGDRGREVSVRDAGEEGPIGAREASWNLRDPALRPDPAPSGSRTPGSPRCPEGTKPARRTASGMTTSGHTGPRASIAHDASVHREGLAPRGCADIVALCPGSRWPRAAPPASVSCTVPARVQHREATVQALLGPDQPVVRDRRVGVGGQGDTVPRPPSRLAIRAQTVPAVMRTWMRWSALGPHVHLAHGDVGARLDGDGGAVEKGDQGPTPRAP